MKTSEFLAACGKEIGNTHHISTQIGCSIEEFIELLECLTFGCSTMNECRSEAMGALDYIAKHLKKGTRLTHIQKGQRENALDALCDITVTVDGIAYLAGMDKPKADAKVLESNAAKLVGGKPIILEGGKIGKPEGWQAPSLQDCV